MRPSLIASRQASSAVIVIGLSQMPPIILSWPASMRLAISISPSRLSSSTLPISRRYMRTGSSVRPSSSSSPVASAATTAVLAGSAGLAARSLFLLLGLDDVDAGFRQHRHRVLDLLGGHFVGRQGGVQLVIGDVAALLALLDELLELGAEGVEQGGVGAFFAGVGGFGLRYGRGFGRHYSFLGCDKRVQRPIRAVNLAARRGCGRAIPLKLPFYYMGLKFKRDRVSPPYSAASLLSGAGFDAFPPHPVENGLQSPQILLGHVLSEGFFGPLQLLRDRP